jgi:hypothetical protein
LQWLIRWRKKRRWVVGWRHSTEGSSWWSSNIITAETSKEAAQKLLDVIDYEKHIKHTDKYLVCHLYKVSEDYIQYNLCREAVAVLDERTS